MKIFETRKTTKREDGVDLISSMPDAILLLILSRLPSTEELIRSSILSRRWMQLWTAVPSLDIDIDIDVRDGGKYNESDFKEFVYWILASKTVDLNTFRLYCSDYYSMATVWRWIRIAVNRNVKQLDLTFSPEKDSEETDDDIVMPYFLVTCCSLEVLKLCLFERGLILPKFIGFPALRVLELSYVHLLEDENLVKAFLQSCPLLEDLSLIGCSMSWIDLLCISCPKLNKLKIENDEIQRMCNSIKISCPKLVFLELTGPTADDFFFESLDSLKEAVIVPPEPEPELIGNTTSVLLPGISHVESLQIDLYFFCQCIDAASDLALRNLKTLVLTTTISAFTIYELLKILKYYPKMESLKLIIKEEFSVWEERKLDEAETRSSLNPDLNGVEFLELNGQKPKLVLVPCSKDGSKFMEMVFSWGNKPKHSH